MNLKMNQIMIFKLICSAGLISVCFSCLDAASLDSSSQNITNHRPLVIIRRKTLTPEDIPDVELLLLPLAGKNATKSALRHRFLSPLNMDVTSLMRQHIMSPTSRFNSSTFLGRQDNLRLPCSCSEGVCACCSGILLDFFQQKACIKITYTPNDFSFDVAMTMNERVLYRNRVTGKNPAPMCISPPRMNNLKVCAKMSNVYFPGRNFHFCLDMVGRWNSFELFDISFDCLRMGAQGIALVKPEDGGGLPVYESDGGLDADIDAGEDDIEDYDENVVRSLLDIFNL